MTERRIPNGIGGLRIDLVFTQTERYYVTEKALAMVPEALITKADRDDFLIELFEQHTGSAYCDELFYHDASPYCGCEIEEVDPDV